MASKARARAELNLKNFPWHGSESDKWHARDQAFKAMMRTFKKRCDDYGIKSEAKKHEFFERKSDKEKRKRKEANLRRIREENFLKNGPKERKDKREQNQN